MWPPIIESIKFVPRHCCLVESAHTWDGTGCEFDSWQCRIYTISHVHWAYDYSAPFGVLWVYVPREPQRDPSNPDLTPKLCWKKLSNLKNRVQIINHYSRERFVDILIQKVSDHWQFSFLELILNVRKYRKYHAGIYKYLENLPACSRIAPGFRSLWQLWFHPDRFESIHKHSSIWAASDTMLHHSFPFESWKSTNSDRLESYIYRLILSMHCWTHQSHSIDNTWCTR